MLFAFCDHSFNSGNFIRSWMSGASRLLIPVSLVISLIPPLEVDAKTKHAASARTTSHHAAQAHHINKSNHGTKRGPARTATRSSRTASRKQSIIVVSRRHGRRVVHVVQRTPVSYPEPHAENVQNSNTLTSVYRLYDRGLNERLEGRYEDAAKTLLEANNSYSSAQKGLTLEAMINYELGQAAEACNNYSLAADAYGRTLRLKPNMIDASVRLASMLMKAGHPELALSRAREAVAMYPNDPRAHQILSLVLDKTGASADAKTERDSAKSLVKSGSSVNSDPSDMSVDANGQGSTPSAAATNSQPGANESTTTSTTTNSSDPSSIPSATSPLYSPSTKPLTTDPARVPGAPVDNDVMP